MTNRRIHAGVTGRVQGVYFRYSTRDEAMRLGLKGWVRNRTDGSVELEAEGPAKAVDELLAWLRHGPPAAAVAQVDWQEMTPGKAVGQNFQIRPTA